MSECVPPSPQLLVSVVQGRVEAGAGGPGAEVLRGEGEGGL